MRERLLLGTFFDALKTIVRKQRIVRGNCTSEPKFFAIKKTTLIKIIVSNDLF